MKYGVLMHTTTRNLGDEIQSYASARFLPHVDYIVDRENIDAFQSENNEPVAVIMSAWWMWQKWNWPPAECIYPYLTSIHLNQYDIYRNSSPIKNEWVEGIGGDYFRAYGPVGVRDTSSLQYFTERSIDAYFSGCITLTLPKQKKTKDAGKYVCLVDLKPSLEEAARKWLKGSGLEIRVFSHHCDYRESDDSFETRMNKTEEILTQYQNAKFVITRRLHVTLPCLAMEVPVVSVVNMKDEGNSTRWSPYTDWVNYVSEQDFIDGNFDYDYKNPPKNPDKYIETREKLIAGINEFIKEAEALGDKSTAQIKKTTFTEEEARSWQYKLMRQTLTAWLNGSRGMLKKYKQSKTKVNRLQKENEELRALNGMGKREEKKDSFFVHYAKAIKKRLKKR